LLEDHQQIIGKVRPFPSDPQISSIAPVQQLVGRDGHRPGLSPHRRRHRTRPREDAAIAAWGMAFKDSAYMVTANGNNNYSLAVPENALNYVRTNLNATPHFIWANSATSDPDRPG
jgi:hypothetical protein